MRTYARFIHLIDTIAIVTGGIGHYGVGGFFSFPDQREKNIEKRTSRPHGIPFFHHTLVGLTDMAGLTDLTEHLILTWPPFGVSFMLIFITPFINSSLLTSHLWHS